MWRLDFKQGANQQHTKCSGSIWSLADKADVLLTRSLLAALRNQRIHTWNVCQIICMSCHFWETLWYQIWNTLNVHCYALKQNSNIRPGTYRSIQIFMLNFVEIHLVFHFGEKVCWSDNLRAYLTCLISRKIQK